MSSEQKQNNEKEYIRKYGEKFRVVGYLPPRYATLFDAYVKFNDGESESSCLVEMVKTFFNSMPEQQRQRIINHSKNSY